MRNFNEFEKKTLEHIVEQGSSTTFKTTLLPLIGVAAIIADVTLEFNVESKTIVLFSDKPPQKEKEKEAFEVEQYNKITSILHHLAAVLSLLSYLEKNNLIYIFQMHPYNTSHILDANPKYEKSNTNFRYNIKLDDSTKSYVFENLIKSIFPTPELEAYVKNGFKDSEQIRHDENQKLQRDSLNTAYVLGAVSIVVAIFSLLVSAFSGAISFLSLFR